MPWEDCTYPEGIIAQLTGWNRVMRGVVIGDVREREVLGESQYATLYHVEVSDVAAGATTIGSTILVHEPGASLLLDVGERYVMVLAQGPRAEYLTLLQAGYGAFKDSGDELFVECVPGDTTTIQMSPEALAEDLVTRLDLAD